MTATVWNTLYSFVAPESSPEDPSSQTAAQTSSVANSVLSQRGEPHPLEAPRADIPISPQEPHQHLRSIETTATPPQQVQQATDQLGRLRNRLSHLIVYYLIGILSGFLDDNSLNPVSDSTPAFSGAKSRKNVNSANEKVFIANMREAIISSPASGFMKTLLCQLLPTLVRFYDRSIGTLLTKFDTYLSEELMQDIFSGSDSEVSKRLLSFIQNMLGDLMLEFGKAHSLSEEERPPAVSLAVKDEIIIREKALHTMCQSSASNLQDRLTKACKERYSHYDQHATAAKRIVLARYGMQDSADEMTTEKDANGNDGIDRVVARIVNTKAPHASAEEVIQLHQETKEQLLRAVAQEQIRLTLEESAARQLVFNRHHHILTPGNFEADLDQLARAIAERESHQNPDEAPSIETIKAALLKEIEEAKGNPEVQKIADQRMLELWDIVEESVIHDHVSLCSLDPEGFQIELAAVKTNLQEIKERMKHEHAAFKKAVGAKTMEPSRQDLGKAEAEIMAELYPNRTVRDLTPEEKAIVDQRTHERATGACHGHMHAQLCHALVRRLAGINIQFYDPPGKVVVDTYNRLRSQSAFTLVRILKNTFIGLYALLLGLKAIIQLPLNSVLSHLLRGILAKRLVNIMTTIFGTVFALSSESDGFKGLLYQVLNETLGKTSSTPTDRASSEAMVSIDLSAAREKYCAMRGITNYQALSELERQETDQKIDLLIAILTHQNTSLEAITTEEENALLNQVDDLYAAKGHAEGLINGFIRVVESVNGETRVMRLVKWHKAKIAMLIAKQALANIPRLRPSDTNQALEHHKLSAYASLSQMFEAWSDEHPTDFATIREKGRREETRFFQATLPKVIHTAAQQGAASIAEAVGGEFFRFVRDHSHQVVRSATGSLVGGFAEFTVGPTAESVLRNAMNMFLHPVMIEGALARGTKRLITHLKASSDRLAEERRRRLREENRLVRTRMRQGPHTVIGGVHGQAVWIPT